MLRFLYLVVFLSLGFLVQFYQKKGIISSLLFNSRNDRVRPMIQYRRPCTSNFLVIVERSTTRSVNGTRSFSLSLSLFIFSMIESGSTTFAEWFHGDCDNGERGRCISCFIYTHYTHKENTITLPERVESELQFTMEKQDKNFRTPRWLNQKILILISSTWSNSFGEKSLRGWNQILEFHHIFWINTISPIFFIIIYLLYFKDFTFSLLIEFI